MTDAVRIAAVQTDAAEPPRVAQLPAARLQRRPVQLGLRARAAGLPDVAAPRDAARQVVAAARLEQRRRRLAR